MKKLLVSFCSIILLASCAKDEEISMIAPTPTVTNNKTETNFTTLSGDDWIWINHGNKVQIYNPATTSWNGAPIWQWEPTNAKGYSNYAISHWSGPTDFKVRTIPAWGGNWIATVGGDLATIAAYPSGQKRWAFKIGTDVYPHGAELLPNGNIAVAATGNNTVKVFASSIGTDNTTHAWIPLTSAHAVLWDPTIDRLWAIGKDRLIALIVGGTDANPTLTEDTARRGMLPTTWGHDIAADINDSNILWVTTNGVATNGGVYSFNKTTKQFSNAPGGVFKTFVKGISRQPSGIFVQTRPDSKKTPIPSPAVLNPSWRTMYVDFYSATGAYLYSRTKSNASIYKAKIFRTPY